MNEIKKYGETKTDRWALESQKSREIVSEIMNFGVNQDQLNQIINLLALELENRDHMNEYRNVFKNIQNSDLIGDESTSKIILDS
jgi:hypothetical protein